VQELLPDAGSTCYKDMLPKLALHLVLVRFISADCGMILLLPLFSRHFEHIYSCKEWIGVVIGSWEAVRGPQAPLYPLYLQKCP